MKKKKQFILIFLVIIILAAVISLELNVYFKEHRAVTSTSTPLAILSFTDCELAGYPIMESYPRKCKTADGKMYTEELKEKITYINATSDLIMVTSPYAGSVTDKEFFIKGKARGGWYFEASFPVQILDKDGGVLMSTQAQAQSDWMTSEFVPFTARITIPKKYTGVATVVLKKDNPSGLPEKDASISFKVLIGY